MDEKDIREEEISATEEEAAIAESVTDDTDQQVESADHDFDTQSFVERYGDEIRAFIAQAGEKIHGKLDDDEKDEDGEKTDAPDKPKKKKRRKKHYLIKFAITCGVIVALICFLMSPYFAIKNIEIEGAKNFSTDEIASKVGVKRGKNIFRIHERDIKKNVKDDAYISNISMKRKLPNTLLITISERTEAAMIKYDKQYVIMDKNGIVLRKTKKKTKLTQFDDLTIKDMTVGQEIVVKEKKKLDQSFAVLREMNQEDLFFKKISISKGTLRAYIYSKLLVKGKREYVMNSLENGNLKHVLDDIYKREIKKGTIKVDGGKYISYTPEVE